MSDVDTAEIRPGPGSPAQAELFGLAPSQEPSEAEEIQAEGSGEVVHADCLDGLGMLDSGSVDLVCMDPPFFSKRNYGEFDDRWESRKAYLEFMWLVLCKCARVMKPDASIYLHCDTSACHRIRVLMDEVFGERNFRNEIVWLYDSPSSAKRCYPRKHDVILFYARGDYTFNCDDIRVPMKAVNARGGYKALGKGTGKFKNMELTDEQRKDVLAKGKVARDHWDDISPAYRLPKEHVFYPTQKPVKMLERIIKASSNPCDVVLDPMCGSGTALVAAKRLGRNYLGIDRNERAASLARERLAGV